MRGRGTGHRSLYWAAIVSLWTETSLGQATPPASALQPTVYLEASPCLANEQPLPLYNALLIELAEAKLEPAWTKQDGSPGLELLDCDLEQGTLALRVSATDEPAPRATTLDLRDVPSVARPRTAAVALVEWLLTLRPRPRQDELRAPAAPAPTLPPAPPDTSPTNSSAPNEQISTTGPDFRRFHVQLGPSLTLINATPEVLRGAHLMFEYQWARHFHFVSGVSYARRRADVWLGTAHVDLFLIEAGVGLSPLREDYLRLSLLAQAGPAFAQAHSDFEVQEPLSTRPIVLVRFRLGLRVPLTPRWHLHPFADFGPILQGARFTEGGQPLFSLQAFAFESGLALGFSP